MQAAEQKSALRAAVWSGRRAQDPARRDAAGEALAGHGLAWALDHVPPGGTVTAYLGVDAEPPTAALLERLHRGGLRVFLPVCLPERQLAWVQWTPGIAFARSRYAPVQEPVGPHVTTEELAAGGPERLPLSAVLLPATALDADGRRLGQGGGYYDRFLARLDGLGVRPATAALVFDDELLAAGAVPADSLDRRVGSAVTPGGVVALGEGAGTAAGGSGAAADPE
jgi:5-formyltetrahydrofolate cyclo-ligase